MRGSAASAAAPSAAGFFDAGGPQPPETPPTKRARREYAAQLQAEAPGSDEESERLPGPTPESADEAEAQPDRIISPAVYDELMQLHTRLGELLAGLPIHMRGGGESTA